MGINLSTKKLTFYDKKLTVIRTKNNDSDAEYITLVNVEPDDIINESFAFNSSASTSGSAPPTPTPSLSSAQMRRTSLTTDNLSDGKRGPSIYAKPLKLRPKSMMILTEDSNSGQSNDDSNGTVVNQNISNLTIENAMIRRSVEKFVRRSVVKIVQHENQRNCQCDDCISRRFNILNWFLPNCTRKSAERLLRSKPDGTFLIRKSQKFPGQYTVSFNCGQMARHCLVLRSVYGFGLMNPYKFNSLQQFVNHYSKVSLAEFNEKLDTKLKYPIFN